MATLAEFAQRLEESGIVEPATLKSLLAAQEPLAAPAIWPAS